MSEYSYLKFARQSRYSGEKLTYSTHEKDGVFKQIITIINGFQQRVSPVFRALCLEHRAKNKSKRDFKLFRSTTPDFLRGVKGLENLLHDNSMIDLRILSLNVTNFVLRCYCQILHLREEKEIITCHIINHHLLKTTKTLSPKSMNV